jgi:hypothetical protein
LPYRLRDTAWAPLLDHARHRVSQSLTTALGHLAIMGGFLLITAAGPEPIALSGR